MVLSIKTSFKGAKRTHEFLTDRVMIGRLTRADPPGLDLSADVCVSRQHAVIVVKDGVAWLTDLGSRYGTQVNRREIRAAGEWRLWPEDTVVVGETTLRVSVTAGESPASSSKEAGASKADVQITGMLDTGQPLTPGALQENSATENRLALLLDLPAQFSAQKSLDALLQLIMDRIVAVIPSARRGALLLRDPNRDVLLLKAYVSTNEPAVSESLARRALTEKRGFIWRSGGAGDTSVSIREHHIVQGMYAPLQWLDQVFGVVCVDSPVATDSFQEEDLRFLITTGQYAAMVFAERQFRADLERSTCLLDRLLANFSGKVRGVLLEQARLGKLRPGGTKSEVTVLFCDICGFTARAAEMDAQDVVNMLNDYFQVLVGVIVQHGGTVDKFLGDGILAVFGSPEPDAQQHEHAITAALKLLAGAQQVGQLRLQRGDVACQIRIGVSCGEVFHGFVGGLDFLQFTVIGDAVNRASRFCAAAGIGEILISPELFQRVFSQIRAEKTNVQTKEGELTGYLVREMKV